MTLQKGEERRATREKKAQVIVAMRSNVECLRKAEKGKNEKAMKKNPVAIPLGSRLDE